MNETLDFPMTMDQFQRYSVLAVFIEAFYSGKKIRILDVGGLSPDKTGSSFFLPIKKIFSGNATVVDTSFHTGQNFIQGNGLNLPFADNSFDVVVALDVLEHIPRDKRETFIQELCRATKGCVLISAPFKDNQIEQVETLLNEQIKQQYGIEHQQLKEHKERGLPDIANVSQLLGKWLPHGVDFSYGSLKNWLALQSLKNCFLMEKTTPAIHSFLDKWYEEVFAASDFEPPFARHFWFHSADTRQPKLNKVVKHMQEILPIRKQPTVSWNDVLTFHKALVAYFCRHRFSAVVVSSGQPKYLSECLNHLLTQKVEQELEVFVWDIACDKSVQKLVKENFPGLKYLFPEQGDKLSHALLKLFSRLRGDFILLISDNILLPSQSITQFYELLIKDPDSGLLSPRIDWDGVEAVSWGESAAEMTDQKVDVQNAAWIKSECLFLRKEALCERQWENVPLASKTIFRWTRTEASKRIMYAPQTTVYKK